MNSKYSYSKTFMKGAIYDCSFPHNVRLVSTLPIPRPNKSQVLIQVMAASLNPVDYKIITPKIPFVRWLLPLTVGRDFSGKIIELGPKVTSFKVGDEVFGNAIGGSFQEFTVADINHIALKPQNMNFKQAATLGLAPTTSLQSLKLAGLKKSGNVLIIGAGGGTGRFAVVIAKHYEARVVAVCSGRNAEDVQKLGADKVVDYTNKEFLKDFENEHFDSIYDTVTSPDDPDQTKIFKPFLKKSGRYVAINGTPLNFTRGLFGIPSDRHYLLLLKWNRKDLETIAEIMKDQNMDLVIDSVYNLNQKDVEAVFEKQKSRRAKGKIIVIISNS